MTDEAHSLARQEELNVRHWEQLLRSSHAPAAEWSLLIAYLARVDCDGDHSSPVHASRLEFAQRAFERLLARDSLAFARSDAHRTMLVRRFRPLLLAKLPPA